MRVIVLGASGYSGLELLRWLSRHPSAAVVGASSDRWAGRPTAELLHGSVERFEAHEAVLARDAELAFLATPAETSLKLAPALLARGLRVIDLSGAFRLRELGGYPSFYGFAHPAPALVAEAHYGLPELFGPPPAGARLVANPGCYATAAALALAPLAGFVEPGRTVMLDGKSGTSGAGRKADEPFSFTEVSQTIRPYRVVGHQHVPEIEQSTGLSISFAPHLIPIPRGLVVTAQAPARAGVELAALEAALEARYARAPLVRVVRGVPELARVVHTPFTEVAVAFDARTRTLVAMAALDNLVKGAAGQAIQNLNLLCGLDETVALGPNRK